MCPSDEHEEQQAEGLERRDTVTLYRPVGQAELDLIAEKDWTAFPPRLPFQPIFYPVLNADYAAQIARDWNTKDKASGYAGYVLRFEVESTVAHSYDVQTVGATHHQELWVPADELDAFNRAIVGRIQVVAEFRGAPNPGEDRDGR